MAQQIEAQIVKESVLFKKLKAGEVKLYPMGKPKPAFTAVTSGDAAVISKETLAQAKAKWAVKAAFDEPIWSRKKGSEQLKGKNAGLTCAGLEVAAALPDKHCIQCCEECLHRAQAKMFEKPQGPLGLGGRHAMTWAIIKPAVEIAGEVRPENRAYLCCRHLAMLNNVNIAGSWEQYRKQAATGKTGIVELDMADSTVPPVEQMTYQQRFAWIKMHSAWPSSWMRPMHHADYIFKIEAHGQAELPVATKTAGKYYLHDKEYHPRQYTFFKADKLDDGGGWFKQISVCNNPQCKGCLLDLEKYWSYEMQCWVNIKDYVYLDYQFGLSRPVSSMLYAKGQFSGFTQAAVVTKDALFIPEYLLYTWTLQKEMEGPCWEEYTCDPRTFAKVQLAQGSGLGWVVLNPLGDFGKEQILNSAFGYILPEWIIETKAVE